MLILTDNEPRGLGYMEIDQRAVPAALPPGVQRHFEADTYTCRHCEGVVVMESMRKRERYKCSGCSHHICDGCAAKRVTGEPCKTYAQYVDELREREIRQPDFHHLAVNPKE
jgi:hypothetical protein